jgi:hypothetical protein
MSRRACICASLLLVGCLIASFFVLPRMEAAYPSNSMDDVLFISSPEFVKRATLGYSGLLADIYWIRAVQYFGRKHEKDSMEYKALAPLLDITTTLDPNLVVAYEWGSTFLDQPPPMGVGDNKAAIALIEKGIRNNPENWHLYFTMGFLQYLGQHDYQAAAKTFSEGSRVPGANPMLKAMAARMLTDAGSLETARYMWQSLYDESNDKDVKRTAQLHMACLLVDEEVPRLQSLVDDFRNRFGRSPESWAELISAGRLRGVPLDPIGQPYLLRDGKVLVSDPKKLPFIHEGKPA